MAPISTNQPYMLTGAFKSTSEIGGKFSDNILYTERQVILFDMHGFIIRNKQWELPVSSQVIGYVKYNPQDASGTQNSPDGTLRDMLAVGVADTGGGDYDALLRLRAY